MGVCVSITYKSLPYLQHWHRRYFVLWSSKVMEYYSSSNKKPHEYLKTIDLTRCDDLVAPVPMKRANVIKVTIRDGEKVRNYLFECESKEGMDDWVKHLVEVLGFTTGDSLCVYYVGICKFSLHATINGSCTTTCFYLRR